MRDRILIAGGGTGGHVYPAIATIEALEEKGQFDFLFVGGKKGMEMNLIPKYGIVMKSIWVSGFQRYFTLRNLLFPLKLLVSIIQSWKIIHDFNPAVVVGTGGYVTGPVLYVASKLGRPVLIQEQDVFPGVTTRLLKRYADRICIAFEGAKEYFEDHLEKIVVTGNPVRKSLKAKSKSDALKRWNFDAGKPVLFVFGGSQGARAINQAMVEILPNLVDEHNVQVLWQTGEKEYNRVLAGMSYDLPGVAVKVLPFIHEMEDAYSAADIIVSRAGAITLAELAMVQKPVVLIPYPFAAGKHQEHNARFIEQEGAAVMIRQGEEWSQKLLDTLIRLLDDRPLQSKMGDSWRKLARPNAAAQIADEVIKLIKKN
jgi:UDP-N-acetylglucosamine--N-acetylmuramyl-(pentapeptide) pyrophosphoryl-undecaprenol N-acetylglucosamine transferase